MLLYVIPNEPLCQKTRKWLEAKAKQQLILRKAGSLL